MHKLNDCKSSPRATQDVPLRCPAPPALLHCPPGAAQCRIQPTALPHPPRSLPTGKLLELRQDRLEEVIVDLVGGTVVSEVEEIVH